MKRQWGRLRLWWSDRQRARAEFLQARAERTVTRLQASHGMHAHPYRDGTLKRVLGPAKWCSEPACRAMAEVERQFRDAGHRLP